MGAAPVWARLSQQVRLGSDYSLRGSVFVSSAAPLTNADSLSYLRSQSDIYYNRTMLLPTQNRQ